MSCAGERGDSWCRHVHQMRDHNGNMLRSNAKPPIPSNLKQHGIASYERLLHASGTSVFVGLNIYIPFTLLTAKNAGGLTYNIYIYIIIITTINIIILIIIIIIIISIHMAKDRIHTYAYI